MTSAEAVLNIKSTQGSTGPDTLRRGAFRR
jgi:hypothetical protein